MKKLALVLLAALAAVGCAQIESVQVRVKDAQDNAVKLRDQNIANAASATVTRTSRPRLAGDQITLRAANALPAVFERRIVYSTQGAQTLQEVLAAIGQLAGITIVASEIAPSSIAPAVPVPGPQPMSQPAPATGLQGRVQLEFDGRLRLALDEIATKNDAAWRFVATTNTVEFFRFETRTLAVGLPRGAKSVTSQMAVSSAGGGSGGSSSSGGGARSGATQVSVAQSISIDPWNSMMTGIQSILGEPEQGRPGSGAPLTGTSTSALTASGPNGRAAASPDFGIITVTARPAVLERIASYVRAINTRFAQNVMIDVKILNLSLDREAALGFSLDLVYKRINGDGISVAGGAPLALGNGIPGTIIGSLGHGRWSGSDVVARALQQFGDVSVQTHQQAIAINGQPAPMQFAQTIPYVPSRQVTTVPNVGVTESASAESRVVGFSANFIPSIQGDNRILLEYNMNIEELVSIDSFPSGQNTIQVPRTTIQSLPGAAYLRDGQAIVLFAFDKNRDSVSAANSPSGASKAGRNQREILIVVIQAYGGLKDV